jgi:hypothetical protein
MMSRLSHKWRRNFALAVTFMLLVIAGAIVGIVQSNAAVPGVGTQARPLLISNAEELADLGKLVDEGNNALARRLHIYSINGSAPSALPGHCDDFSTQANGGENPNAEQPTDQETCELEPGDYYGSDQVTWQGTWNDDANDAVVYIKITADIDLSEWGADGDDAHGDGKGWKPIGWDKDKSFLAHLDGDGHVINNLYINVTNPVGTTRLGLFGNVGGESHTGNFASVENLGIESGSIFGDHTGSIMAGGIAGYSAGIMTNVFNKADVDVRGNVLADSDYTAAGGIVGHNAGMIVNSYNDGSVSVTAKSGTYSCQNIYAGGIAGVSYNTVASFPPNHIVNAYNKGHVSAKSLSSETETGAYAGGISGELSVISIAGAGLISKAINFGDVEAYSKEDNFAFAAGILAHLGRESNVRDNVVLSKSITSNGSNAARIVASATNDGSTMWNGLHNNYAWESDSAEGAWCTLPEMQWSQWSGPSNRDGKNGYTIRTGDVVNVDFWKGLGNYAEVAGVGLSPEFDDNEWTITTNKLPILKPQSSSPTGLFGVQDTTLPKWISDNPTAPSTNWEIDGSDDTTNVYKIVTPENLACLAVITNTPPLDADGGTVESLDESDNIPNNFSSSARYFKMMNDLDLAQWATQKTVDDGVISQATFDSIGPAYGYVEAYCAEGENGVSDNPDPIQACREGQDGNEDGNEAAYDDNGSWHFAHNKGWTPIGWSSYSEVSPDTPFSGYFDGGGHTISNLYTNYVDDDTAYVGLFGFMAVNESNPVVGEVKNIGIESGYIQAENSAVAGIVGRCDDSQVNHVYNKGTIYGNSSVGGIVGWGSGCTVSNTYNSGNIFGSGDVGGIVGFARNGFEDGTSILYSYNTGDIKPNNSSTDNFGGIVGHGFMAEINFTYSIGSVSAQDWVGGIAGSFYSDEELGQIKNSVAAVSSIAILDTGTDNVIGEGNRIIANGWGEGSARNNYAWDPEGITGDYCTLPRLHQTRWSDAGNRNGANGFTISTADVHKANFWKSAGTNAAASSQTPAYDNRPQLGVGFDDSASGPWETIVDGQLPTLRGMPAPTSGAGQSSAMPKHLANVGSATITNPLMTGLQTHDYEIGEPVQLACLAKITNSVATNSQQVGKFFKLTSDIDLSAWSSTDNSGGFPVGDELHGDGKGWMPIGNTRQYEDYENNQFDLTFGGHFNGDGHVVNNLSIENDGSNESGSNWPVGFFGAVKNAEIKNFGIKSGMVNGAEIVGGLVGFCDNSTLDGAWTKVGVIATGDYVGGLVGLAGALSGEEYEESLIGAASGCDINGSYTLGSIIGVQYVGGLVGKATETDINRTYSKGYVTGTSDVGGIAGSLDSSSISNSYVTGFIKASGGGHPVGGLSGSISNASSVDSTFVSGYVQGSYPVGGIVGVDLDNSADSTISHSLYASTGLDAASDGTNTNDQQRSGRILGGNNYKVNDAITTETTLSNNYGYDYTSSNFESCSDYLNLGETWFFLMNNHATEGVSHDHYNGADVSENTISGTGTALWANTMLNFDVSIWNINAGNGFPTLKNVGDQFVVYPLWLTKGNGTSEPLARGITTAQELSCLARDTNGDASHPNPTFQGSYGTYYKLAADIDLSEWNSSPSSNGGGAGWTPIGFATWSGYSLNPDHTFRGNFDGQGHIISNLYINGGSNDRNDVGLFGFVGDNSGSAAPRSIKNLGIESGNVQTTGERVGGIIGSIALPWGGSYSINNVFNNANITSTDGDPDDGNRVGGIVGDAQNLDVIISNAYNTGTITGLGGGYVGGIVGTINEAMIEKTYNTGKIISSGEHTGGISGEVPNVETVLGDSVQLGSSISPQDAFRITDNAVQLGDTNVYDNYGWANAPGDEYLDCSFPSLTPGFQPKIWNNIGQNMNDGIDVTSATLISDTDDFWHNNVYFDDTNWLIQPGKLPILKTATGGVFSGQNGADQMPQWIKDDFDLNGGSTGVTVGTTVDNPILIGTADQLACLAKITNTHISLPHPNMQDIRGKYFELTADIDLREWATQKAVDDGVVSQAYLDGIDAKHGYQSLCSRKPGQDPDPQTACEEGADNNFGNDFDNGVYTAPRANGWIPIGGYVGGGNYLETEFEGIFDGAGHKIENLYIDVERNNADNWESISGLFGRTASPAEIKDLSIVSGDIHVVSNCMTYVGTLVGYSMDTKIEYVKTSVNISVEQIGNDERPAIVGGIVGLYRNRDLSNVSNSGNIIVVSNSVSTNGDYVGGIVGTYEGDYANSHTIEYAYNSGFIDYANTNPDGHGSAGGIAGANQGMADIIENSAFFGKYVKVDNSSNSARIYGVSLYPSYPPTLSDNNSWTETASTDEEFECTTRTLSGTGPIAGNFTGKTAGGKSGADMSAYDISQLSIWDPVLFPIPRHILDDIAPNPPNYVWGDGTNQLKISTPEQLACLAKATNTAETNSWVADKNFKLTADIDLKTYPTEQTVADGVITSAERTEYNALPGRINGKGFKPIGSFDSNLPFDANFDGDGHIIKNLYMNFNTNGHGLFGYAYSESSNKTIQNVGIESGFIQGNNSGTGALVGILDAFSVNNVFNKATVSGDQEVGGLFGRTQGQNGDAAYVINAYNTGNIFATGNKVGGIVGALGGNYSEINTTYNVGDVYGVNWTSGIAGMVSDISSILNSVSLGRVISEKPVSSGGKYRVYGTEGDDAGFQNYGWAPASQTDPTCASVQEFSPSGYAPASWDNDDRGVDGADVFGSTLIGTGEDYGANWWSTAVSFNFSNWVLADGKLPTLKVTGTGATMNEQDDDLPQWIKNDTGTGTLSSETNPYQIRDAAALACLATRTNADLSPWGMTTGKFFKLNADIDLGGENSAVQPTAPGSGWTPIGEPDHEFRGTFDGNGHTIKNLYILANGTSNSGLFGIIHGATLKNFGVESGVIEGTVGDSSNLGLVGIAQNSSTIDQVFNGIHISVSGASGNSGTVRAGGISGRLLDGSEIINSYNTGNVSVTNVSESNIYPQVGGIAGFVDSSHIYRSYNIGNITSLSASSTVDNAGGIVGAATGGSTAPLLINVYNLGDVEGRTGFSVGGILGNGSSAIINYAYTAGKITSASDLFDRRGIGNTSNITNAMQIGSYHTTGGMDTKNYIVDGSTQNILPNSNIWQEETWIGTAVPALNFSPTGYDEELKHVATIDECYPPLASFTGNTAWCQADHRLPVLIDVVRPNLQTNISGRLDFALTDFIPSVVVEQANDLTSTPVSKGVECSGSPDVPNCTGFAKKSVDQTVQLITNLAEVKGVAGFDDHDGGTFRDLQILTADNTSINDVGAPQSSAEDISSNPVDWADAVAAVLPDPESGRVSFKIKSGFEGTIHLTLFNMNSALWVQHDVKVSLSGVTITYHYGLPDAIATDESGDEALNGSQAGLPASDTSQQVGDPFTAPGSFPTVTGYTASGWTTAKDGAGTPFISDTTEITESNGMQTDDGNTLDLYPIWTGQPLQITFSAINSPYCFGGSMLSNIASVYGADFPDSTDACSGGAVMSSSNADPLTSGQGEWVFDKWTGGNPGAAIVHPTFSTSELTWDGTKWNVELVANFNYVHTVNFYNGTFDNDAAELGIKGSKIGVGPTSDGAYLLDDLKADSDIFEAQPLPAVPDGGQPGYRFAGWKFDGDSHIIGAPSLNDEIFDPRGFANVGGFSRNWSTFEPDGNIYTINFVAQWVKLDIEDAFLDGTTLYLHGEGFLSPWYDAASGRGENLLFVLDGGAICTPKDVADWTDTDISCTVSSGTPTTVSVRIGWVHTDDFEADPANSGDPVFGKLYGSTSGTPKSIISERQIHLISGGTDAETISASPCKTLTIGLGQEELPKMSTMPDCQLAGYHFAGWSSMPNPIYTSAVFAPGNLSLGDDSASRYLASNQYLKSGTRLYAIWQKEVTITYYDGFKNNITGDECPIQEYLLSTCKDFLSNSGGNGIGSVVTSYTAADFVNGISSTHYHEGDRYIVPNNATFATHPLFPDRPGYTLTSVVLDSLDGEEILTDGPMKLGTDDVDIILNWRPIEYSLKFTNFRGIDFPGAGQSGPFASWPIVPLSPSFYKNYSYDSEQKIAKLVTYAGIDVNLASNSNPSRVGYNFVGWKTTTSGIAGTYSLGGTSNFTMPARSAEFTDTWSAKTINYEFLSGGTGNHSVSSPLDDPTGINAGLWAANPGDGEIDYVDNTTLVNQPVGQNLTPGFPTIPAAKVPAGYEFECWHSTTTDFCYSPGEEPIVASTDSPTIYMVAKWRRGGSAIHFNLGASFFLDGAGRGVAHDAIEPETSGVFAIPEFGIMPYVQPVKKGYHFIGWADVNGAVGTQGALYSHATSCPNDSTAGDIAGTKCGFNVTAPLANSIYLTAAFAVNSQTVEFAPSAPGTPGADCPVSPATSSVNSLTQFTVASAPAPCPGFVFTGWKLSVYDSDNNGTINPTPGAYTASDAEVVYSSATVGGGTSTIEAGSFPQYWNASAPAGSKAQRNYPYIKNNIAAGLTAMTFPVGPNSKHLFEATFIPVLHTVEFYPSLLTQVEMTGDCDYLQTNVDYDSSILIDGVDTRVFATGSQIPIESSCVPVRKGWDFKGWKLLNDDSNSVGDGTAPGKGTLPTDFGVREVTGGESFELNAVFDAHWSGVFKDYYHAQGPGFRSGEMLDTLTIPNLNALNVDSSEMGIALYLIPFWEPAQYKILFDGNIPDSASTKCSAAVDLTGSPTNYWKDSPVCSSTTGEPLKQMAPVQFSFNSASDIAIADPPIQFQAGLDPAAPPAGGASLPPTRRTLVQTGYSLPGYHQVGWNTCTAEQIDDVDASHPNGKDPFGNSCITVQLNSTNTRFTLRTDGSAVTLRGQGIDGNSAAPISPNGDLVLRAVWAPNDFMIKFNKQQPTSPNVASVNVSGNVPTLTAFFDSNVNGPIELPHGSSNPAPPVLQGWNFLGWNTCTSSELLYTPAISSNGVPCRAFGVGAANTPSTDWIYGNDGEFASFIEADKIPGEPGGVSLVNLYAAWAPKNVTINTRISTDPASAGATLNSPTCTSTTYDASLSDLFAGSCAVSDPAGYTFMGWALDAAAGASGPFLSSGRVNAAIFTDMVASSPTPSITLTAVFVSATGNALRFYDGYTCDPNPTLAQCSAKSLSLGVNGTIPNAGNLLTGPRNSPVLDGQTATISTYTPHRDHYIFKGYKIYQSSPYGTAESALKMPGATFAVATNDVYLVAQWAPDDENASSPTLHKVVFASDVGLGTLAGLDSGQANGLVDSGTCSGIYDIEGHLAAWSDARQGVEIDAPSGSTVAMPLTACEPTKPGFVFYGWKVTKANVAVVFDTDNYAFPYNLATGGALPEGYGDEPAGLNPYNFEGDVTDSDYGYQEFYRANHNGAGGHARSSFFIPIDIPSGVVLRIVPLFKPAKFSAQIEHDDDQLAALGSPAAPVSTPNSAQVVASNILFKDSTNWITASPAVKAAATVQLPGKTLFRSPGYVVVSWNTCSYAQRTDASPTVDADGIVCQNVALNSAFNIDNKFEKADRTIANPAKLYPVWDVLVETVIENNPAVLPPGTHCAPGQVAFGEAPNGLCYDEGTTEESADETGSPRNCEIAAAGCASDDHPPRKYDPTPNHPITNDPTGDPGINPNGPDDLDPLPTGTHCPVGSVAFNGRCFPIETAQEETDHTPLDPFDPTGPKVCDLTQGGCVEGSDPLPNTPIIPNPGGLPSGHHCTIEHPVAWEGNCYDEGTSIEEADPTVVGPGTVRVCDLTAAGCAPIYPSQPDTPIPPTIGAPPHADLPDNTHCVVPMIAYHGLCYPPGTTIEQVNDDDGTGPDGTDFCTLTQRGCVAGIPPDTDTVLTNPPGEDGLAPEIPVGTHCTPENPIAFNGKCYPEGTTKEEADDSPASPWPGPGNPPKVCELTGGGCATGVPPIADEPITDDPSSVYPRVCEDPDYIIAHDGKCYPPGTTEEEIDRTPVPGGPGGADVPKCSLTGRGCVDGIEPEEHCEGVRSGGICHLFPVPGAPGGEGPGGRPDGSDGGAGVPGSQFDGVVPIPAPGPTPPVCPGTSTPFPSSPANGDRFWCDGTAPEVEYIFNDGGTPGDPSDDYWDPVIWDNWGTLATDRNNEFFRLNDMNNNGDYDEGLGEEDYTSSGAVNHKHITVTYGADDKAVVKTHFAHIGDSWYDQDDFTSGRGYFSPNEKVDVWIFSTPSYLGTTVADANGDVNPEVASLAGVEPGEHHIILQGMGVSGEDYDATHQVSGLLTVLEAPGPDDTRPDDTPPTDLPGAVDNISQTGVDIWMLSILLLLLIATAVVVRTARRPTR